MSIVDISFKSNHIICHPLCEWLISLNIMFLKFNHVVAYNNISFLFMTEYYICVTISHFINLFIYCWIFGPFLLICVMNNDDINIIIYVNVYKIFVNIYHHILGSILRYAELHGNLIFNHFRRY